MSDLTRLLEAAHRGDGGDRAREDLDAIDLAAAEWAEDLVALDDALTARGGGRRPDRPPGRGRSCR